MKSCFTTIDTPVGFMFRQQIVSANHIVESHTLTLVRGLFLLTMLLPPLAVAITGSVRQVMLNLLLTCCGWLPGAVHAMIVVHRWAEVRAPCNLASLADLDA
jgi:uncharacterized membrane protein YqaE (UPF0057 family)